MPRPKRDLHDEIIRVAERLFFRYGIVRTSVEQIAKQLGTSKSALYRWFPSKEAILEAVMLKTLAKIDETTSRIVKSEADFERKLKELTTSTATQLSRFDPIFLRDLAIYAPVLWQEYETRRHARVEKIYGRLFREGRKRGLVRTDIPPRVLTEMYLNLTGLAVDPQVIARCRITSEEMYEAVTRLLLRGANSAG
jgi:AcrR family transcriptional regulator